MIIGIIHNNMANMPVWESIWSWFGYGEVGGKGINLRGKRG